ncbi:MAG: biotin-independent malonate decarboxylase subunit gamma [Isosphaeraceae bacterium]
MGGHPVVALVVGKAISGGFLAHGLQAHRLLALDARGVMVHAMPKESAAHVTRRSVRRWTSIKPCRQSMRRESAWGSPPSLPRATT